MNEVEFWMINGLANRLWPNQPIPTETAEAWWDLGLFSDLELGEVEAALMALCALKQSRPMPANIRRWIIQRRSADLDAPWSEVWAELWGQRDRLDRPADVQWSDATRPFAEHLTAVLLQMLAPSQSDGTTEQAREAQFRDYWESWRSREFERRLTYELPAVKEFLARHHPDVIPPTTTEPTSEK